jgi:hypothetical protein
VLGLLAQYSSFPVLQYSGVYFSLMSASTPVYANK